MDDKDTNHIFTTGKDLQPPKKSQSDTFFKLLRVGASLIEPITGSLLQFMQSHYEQELEIFFGDMAKRINAMQSQLSELSMFSRAMNGDEKAVEIIVKSCRVLAGVFADTHDEMKKQALKSAAFSIMASSSVGNVAAVEHDFFMRWVREFDGIHIRLLKAAAGDIRQVRAIVYDIDGKPTGAVMQEARNSYSSKPCKKAWLELFENGLVNIEHVGTLMTEDGYKLENRTELGIKFLEFITENE